MNSILFKINEYYNRHLEQKISTSIFAGGGISYYFISKKMLYWFSMLKGLVLDLGSGDQKWKTFFPSHIDYLALDYPPAASSCPWRETYPDIYGDGMCLPLKNECVDAVINVFVLEHVVSPEQMIKEISRVLKKDGLLLLTGPGDILMSHGEPDNYFNMTRFAYKMLLEKNHLQIEEEYFPSQFWVSVLHLIYSKIVRNDFYNRNTLLKGLQALVLLISLFVSPILNVIALFMDFITPFDKRGYSTYMVLAKKKI
ncbi:MAG: class I SAM-dependent methyltransferase [Candidatus Marithrix sp.]